MINNSTMKLGILTQSMSGNYGCNLQMYALQTVLQRMGHDVEILNVKVPQLMKPFSKRVVDSIFSLTKICIKILIGRPIYIPIKQSQYNYFCQLISPFHRKYLRGGPPCRGKDELSEYVKRMHFEGFIVGSDQVWRPCYNLNGRLENMFLDFTEGLECKRVAYAASFGVDNWEYTKHQTLNCSILAQRFDAVSVRERSGITLCRDYLGIDAINVLDPTMLLDRIDYEELIDSASQTASGGNLYHYVLDKTEEIQKGIKYVESTLGLTAFTYLNPCPEGTYKLFHKRNSIFPSVEQWLQGFRDADLVLVDSFHGTVFSIIFNKPFWVIGNPKRGMTRFESLLKLFSLEDRLISANELLTINLHSPIDWDFVNKRRSELKSISLDFLKEALKQK